jgi:hypothetical protein
MSFGMLTKEKKTLILSWFAGVEFDVLALGSMRNNEIKIGSANQF